MRYAYGRFRSYANLSADPGMGYLLSCDHEKTDGMSLVSFTQDAPKGTYRIDRVKIDAVSKVSNRANAYKTNKL